MGSQIPQSIDIIAKHFNLPRSDITLECNISFVQYKTFLDIGNAPYM